MRSIVVALAILLLFLSGCEKPSQADPAASSASGTSPLGGEAQRPTPTLASTTITTEREVTPTATQTPIETSVPATVIPTLTPTPIFRGELSLACGQLLPIMATGEPSTTSLEPDAAALAELRAILPESAKPALDRLLDAPGTVGLVAYRVVEAEQGVNLNPDAPMPLASVVKIIHLVAYAQAVAAGELDPAESVMLSTLDRYYLPGLDLGAHMAAVKELEEEGLVFGDPPWVQLEQVPWMMIRHSSNAALDYLHMRLGQTAIEQTAIELGMTSQTAPCPFLGQFLIIDNHTRNRGNDLDAVQAYIDDPEQYGRDVMLLTDAYSQDDSFRQLEAADGRRPSMPAQRLFSENLNPQGSARDYAALMARIAQNGLSNGESSFLTRKYLEWPMRFESNQELFSNLGYKNGSMPGVLTSVYYAYPHGETTPVVVALFFRDLPNRTYQQWRRSSLAHDELARWLLADPEAIPALKAALALD